jgi:predicted DNA-binding WGR domain protein
MSSVTLRRINPGLNMRRFYSLSVERDLLGQTVLVKAWGRIGAAGRVALEPYPDEATATHELRRVATIKAKRGYR